MLLGWRETTTTEIHLKFDPEPKGIFAQIPSLKNSLVRRLVSFERALAMLQITEAGR